MKHKKHSIGFNGKLTVLTLATAMVCGSAVGGTVAWITASSSAIVNTFSYGDIRIGLGSSAAVLLSLEQPDEEPVTDTESAETDGTEKRIVPKNRMVPGKTVELDTTLCIAAGSEACWLFAAIGESDNFADFLTYEIEEGWSLLDPDAEDKVYYREVVDMEDDFRIDALEENFVTTVLRDNELDVRADVTVEQFDELTEETCPKIRITAYAIQRANIDTPETAWEQLRPADEADIGG